MSYAEKNKTEKFSYDSMLFTLAWTNAQTTKQQLKAERIGKTQQKQIKKKKVVRFA